MDKRLFDKLNEKSPKFNQDIIDGLAYVQLKTAKSDVDRVLRTAESTMPDGFTFVDSNICGPQETYRVITGLVNKADARSRAVDMAWNDLYMVKYQFSLDGDPLTDRYQYLPSVKKGNLLSIGDRQFTITPVLGDRCFSIGIDNVFVPLNRAVVTYKQLIHSIDVDGMFTSRLVVWSKLHNKGGTAANGRDSDRLRLGQVYTTIGHYLFAKYGLMETFQKFCKCDIVLLNETNLDSYVTEHKIDLTEYHQIRSRKVKPDGFKAKIQYNTIESDVMILIKRTDASPLAMDLICSFFYMVDFYPEYNDVEELKTTWNWKVWMGFVLWGDQLGHGKLVENVDSHLVTLDKYVDDEVKHLLREEENLEIADFYELCVFILKNMESMIRDNSYEIGSMYNKSLLVNRYVLSDINDNIFKAVFEISNNRKKKHLARDYNKVLGRYMGHATITRLRLTSEKPYMSTCSLPGDNRLFKLGIQVVRQSKTTRDGSRSTSLNVNDPANHLHESILEAGNYLVLPKRSPTGDSTINPTVKLDAKYTIRRKEHLRDLIDSVGDVISRD